VGCWHGYLSGARCRFAYAQLMPLPLTISCSSKSRLVLPSWYRLTWVVPDTVQRYQPVLLCHSIILSGGANSTRTGNFTLGGMRSVMCCLWRDMLYRCWQSCSQQWVKWSCCWPLHRDEQYNTDTALSWWDLSTSGCVYQQRAVAIHQFLFNYFWLDRVAETALQIFHSIILLILVSLVLEIMVFPRDAL